MKSRDIKRLRLSRRATKWELPVLREEVLQARIRGKTKGNNTANNEDEEEEIEKVVILEAIYLSPADDRIIFTATGEFKENLWECDPASLEWYNLPASGENDNKTSSNTTSAGGAAMNFGFSSTNNAPATVFGSRRGTVLAYPRTNIPGSTQISCMIMSERYLICGFRDARVWAIPTDVRNAKLERYIQVQIGNSKRGGIRALTIMNEQYLLIGGDDGVMYTVSIANEGLEAYREAIENAGPLFDADAKFQEKWSGFTSHLTFTDIKEWKLPLFDELLVQGVEVDDITDSEAFFHRGG